MIIAIGTTNKAKVEAVEETIKDYPMLAAATLSAVSVSSGVSDQPFSLDEILQGAKNRASKALESVPSAAYGIGIESGLFALSATQTGFLEACLCCIATQNGQICTGLSCGFEIPPFILSFITEQKMELGQACFHSGITSNQDLGAAEGLIGLLTKGRVTRKKYTQQALVTALIQLENSHLYSIGK